MSAENEREKLVSGNLLQNKLRFLGRFLAISVDGPLVFCSVYDLCIVAKAGNKQMPC